MVPSLRKNGWYVQPYIFNVSDSKKKQGSDWLREGLFLTLRELIMTPPNAQVSWAAVQESSL